MDAFFQANIELIQVNPELNLYDNEWPIWTYQEQVPPAKFVFDGPGQRGCAVNSMVAGGCIVSGAEVRRSILFSHVRVETGASVEEAVVLPSAVIGEGCQIRKAIIEEGCRVPPGTQIGYDPELDHKRYHVSSGGVVLVTPEMLDQSTLSRR